MIPYTRKGRLVVQRYGLAWFLGVTHTDGTWQVARYYAELQKAQDNAGVLIARYADRPLMPVAEAVDLASTLPAPSDAIPSQLENVYDGTPTA